MRISSIIIAVALWATPALAEEAAKKYTVAAVTTPQAVATAQEATYTLTITPVEGWVLKTETPFKILLEAPEDVGLAQSEFRSKDFVDAKAAAKSVATKFTPTAAGDRSIKADLTFFLCTAEICQRFKDKVDLAFKVETLTN